MILTANVVEEGAESVLSGESEGEKLIKSEDQQSTKCHFIYKVCIVLFQKVKISSDTEVCDELPR